MHVRAALGEHQRLAEHPGAEVRERSPARADAPAPRPAGRAGCRSASRTRSAAPASCARPPTARPQCTNTAVPGEDDGETEDPRDVGRRQRIPVHGREQGDAANPVRDRPGDAVERVLARRVEHEEADEAVGVRGHRCRHRGLVAGHARRSARRGPRRGRRARSSTASPAPRPTAPAPIRGPAPLRRPRFSGGSPFWAPSASKKPGEKKCTWASQIIECSRVS